MDEQLKTLLTRLNQNGITITKPGPITRAISKRRNYAVFNNRRMQKTVIIDKQRLKKLLDTDLL